MLDNLVSLHLAYKEIWRNKGRFLLISSVIALITLLVLFLAALGEGLSAGNKEYLGKLDAELILFQEKSELSVAASQLGRSLMNDVQRLPGVAEAGAVGFSSVFITVPESEEPLSVSLFGVEPDRPGTVPVLAGKNLASNRANEAVVGQNVALRTGLQVGDTFTVKSTQASVDEFYILEVIGISDGRQYFLQPAIFVPLLTWDRIRPKPVASDNRGELTFSLIAVQLEDPQAINGMAKKLVANINGIEAVDRRTAYEAAPGYTAQQSTIQTQQGFTLLIGILVVGGFFQIQTLQKIGQVGMLKALGASNMTVGVTSTLQILFTNCFGVVLGVLGTLALAATFPPTVPIVFVGGQVAIAVGGLLLIGPVGGLVSLRLLLKVEPLTALGLAS